MQFSAKDIASVIGGTIEGNPDTRISQIAKIEEATSDSICFIANPKYESYAEKVNAGILIVNHSLKFTNANIGAVIRVADAYAAFTTLLDLYQKMQQQESKSVIEKQSHTGERTTLGENVYLGAFAYVGDDVKIGNNVQIFPNTYIGNKSEIGDNTIIYSGVNIYHETKIGANCILHSGVVIGGDGFGFAPQPDGSYKKIPQTGNVIIEDHVEIGANTTVDRATIGSTIIRKGVKLDNLIQVGHNVEIGENTVIAAQTGISGSAKLGKQTLVGGQVGITGHLKIADGTKIQARAVIIQDIEQPNTSLSGVPAINAREHYRQIAAIKRLPDLLKRIDELEKALKK